MKKIYIVLLGVLVWSCEREDRTSCLFPPVQSWSKDFSVTREYDASTTAHEIDTYNFLADGKLKQYTYLVKGENKDYQETTHLVSIDTLQNSNFDYALTYKAKKVGWELSMNKYYIHANSSLCKEGIYNTQGGSPRYLYMKYTNIDGKPYLTEMSEVGTKSGNEIYRIELDYSNFENDQLTIRTYLMGEIKYKSILQIEKRPISFPDIQYLSFHPINKHRALLYSGYLGTFDYVILDHQSDTESYIRSQKSTYQFDKNNLPREVELIPVKQEDKPVLFKFNFGI